MSAGREGPDALDAMRLAVTALEHDVPGECWATGPNTGDPVEDLVVCPGCRALATLRRAISSEEARRARPAVEDPRDALLAKCAEFFSNSAYRWTLEAATDRRIATSGLMLDEFNEVAAALRAAGVEPTPDAAQEGKAPP